MEKDNPLMLPLGRILKQLRIKDNLNSSDLYDLAQKESPDLFLEENNGLLSEFTDPLIYVEDPLKQQELRESLVESIKNNSGIDLNYSKLEIPQIELKNKARVKIKRDSKYAGQNSGLGTMQGDFGWEGWVNVIFDDGYENSYHKEDLELARVFSKDSLERIVKENEKLLKEVSETPFEDFKDNILKQIGQNILNFPIKEKKDFFKEGDEIEMTAEADKNYTLTKEGSLGKVLSSMEGGEYRVHFTKLTGSSHPYEEKIFNVSGKFMRGLLNLEELVTDAGGIDKYAEKIFTQALDKEVEIIFANEINGKKVSKLITLLKENKIISQNEEKFETDQKAISNFFSSIPSVYERVPNLFSKGMYSPFAERQFNVAQFELTTGCSHNKCTFCNMYEVEHTKKSIKKGEEHIDGVMDALPDDVAKNFERIFIANGDALSMPTLDLNHLIQYSLRKVRARTGKVPRRVALFGSTKNILKKNYDDLHFLNCGGLAEGFLINLINVPHVNLELK